MARTNITKEEARTLIDRMVEKHGLLVKGQDAGYLILTGPTNKHRVCIQNTKFLGRIDTTLPVKGQEGTEDLKAHNGAITCHIVPDLKWLEHYLDMLGDGGVSKQVTNHPRPFAVQKSSAGPKRTPRAVAAPLEEDVGAPSEYIAEGGTLKDRLAEIAARGKRARIRMYVEEKGMTQEEAEAVVYGRIDESDVEEARSNAHSSELNELSREAGLNYET